MKTTKTTKKPELVLPAISVKNLSVAYHKKPVIWDVNIEFPQGKLIAIVGPNGAGKSTFLKAILNLIPRISGRVEILGNPYKQVLKQLSYIPQRKSVDWDYPISVFELVAMGLYGNISWYKPLNTEQKDLIYKVLEQVDLLQLSKRQINQLSGGQQQRAFMARSLIQQSDIYLMDEPFAGIDAVSEAALFKVIDKLRSEHKTILIVHHNLNLIKEYFDYVMMLNLRLIAAGDIKETFTQENLIKTYKGRLTLLEDAAKKALEKGL